MDFEVPKEPIYCGNKEELPEDYDRKGTPLECMKKGYGAALYNAPVEKIKEARKKKKKRLLTTIELKKIAKRLGVKVKDRSNEQIYNGVIMTLSAMLNFLSSQEDEEGDEDDELNNLVIEEED